MPDVMQQSGPRKSIDWAKVVCGIVYEGKHPSAIAKELGVKQKELDKELEKPRLQEQLAKHHEKRLNLVSQAPIASHVTRLSRLESLYKRADMIGDFDSAFKALDKARLEDKQAQEVYGEAERKAPGQIVVNIGEYKEGGAVLEGGDSKAVEPIEVDFTISGAENGTSSGGHNSGEGSQTEGVGSADGNGEVEEEKRPSV